MALRTVHSRHLRRPLLAMTVRIHQCLDKSGISHRGVPHGTQHTERRDVMIAQSWTLAVMQASQARVVHAHAVGQ